MIKFFPSIFSRPKLYKEKIFITLEMSRFLLSVYTEKYLRKEGGEKEMGGAIKARQLLLYPFFLMKHHIF